MAGVLAYAFSSFAVAYACVAAILVNSCFLSRVNGLTLLDYE